LQDTWEINDWLQAEAGLRFDNFEADGPEARAIMEKVDARDDGDRERADVEMILIDKRGQERIRKLLSFSRDEGEDSCRIMFFVEPANVKDTGFLTYDYPDLETEDDQWLYLPALRKVRRISASDRGDYFLGTDFTYEDIKKSGKIEQQDDSTFIFSGKDEFHNQSSGTVRIPRYAQGGFPFSVLISGNKPIKIKPITSRNSSFKLKECLTTCIFRASILERSSISLIRDRR